MYFAWFYFIGTVLGTAKKYGVWIKRRTFVNLGRSKFELSSAHEKYGVWTGPKMGFVQYMKYSNLILLLIAKKVIRVTVCPILDEFFFWESLMYHCYHGKIKVISDITP